MNNLDTRIEEPREYYVYRHLKADTGTPFYIGVGKKPKIYTTHYKEYVRAHQSSKSQSRSNLWINTKNKHGVVVEILGEDLTQKEAYEKEKEFIKLYGKYQDGGILTNLTDGGEGSAGRPVSDEMKKVLSDFRKANPMTWETVEKIRAKTTGQKRTPEQKAALKKALTGVKKKPLSDAHKKFVSQLFKGRKHTDETKDRMRRVQEHRRKKVRCLETGKIYPTAKDAAIELFGRRESNSNIRQVCNGRIPSYKGYHFEFVKEGEYV